VERGQGPAALFLHEQPDLIAAEARTLWGE
jgi:hypothetical protein